MLTSEGHLRLLDVTERGMHSSGAVERFPSFLGAERLQKPTLSSLRGSSVWARQGSLLLTCRMAASNCLSAPTLSPSSNFSRPVSIASRPYAHTLLSGYFLEVELQSQTRQKEGKADDSTGHIPSTWPALQSSGASYPVGLSEAVDSISYAVWQCWKAQEGVSARANESFAILSWSHLTWAPCASAAVLPNKLRWSRKTCVPQS